MQIAQVDTWAPVANTALLIVLAILTRRTQRTSKQARDSAHEATETASAAAVASAEATETAAAAANAVEYVARVVKESHNELIETLVEARQYTDDVDPETHKFEPRRRKDDPTPPTGE